MTVERAIAGLALGAIVAAGLAIAPAIGAPGSAQLVKRPVTLSAQGGIGSFTPAAADPKLAAALARAGIGATGFRFTPTESRRGGNRSVTVAVRSRTAAGASTALASTEPVGRPDPDCLQPRCRCRLAPVRAVG